MKKRWFAVAMAGSFIFVHACSIFKPKADAESSRIEQQLAEINQRIDELNRRVSVLQFTVEDHQKSLQELNKIPPKPPAAPDKASASPPVLPTNEKISVSALQAKPPSVMSESAEEAYKKALSLYNAENYTEAAAIFGAMAENYPGHDLADNALYWIGECRYSQKDYKGAIAEFKRVVRDYPKGSKVPDALLKIGYAYLTLGDRDNAQSFLKKVIKEYPFTPAGAKAGDMLQKMQTP